MMRTLCFNRTTKAFSEISDPALATVGCGEGNSTIWIDINDPRSDSFLEVAKALNFHPLSIEDTRKGHQRPKLEEYPGYYFIIMYEVHYTHKGVLDLRELHLFLGKDYVVTVHTKPIDAIATAEKLWQSWKEEPSTGMLTYLIADTIVDDYFPIADELGDQLNAIEDAVFGEFDATSIERIVQLKKVLINLRRSVVPLREVFNTLLRREQKLFTEEVYFYFQDVYDHTLRVADAIDTLRELVSSIMDAYLSVSGNRMNMIMKRLTSIATILMSVTLVSSIYGMNFEHMPELHWKYGYMIALGSMILVGVILALFLRRIRWL